ncbi:MAG: DUF2313 domain-containing protein [Lachnospiraceae bacterium]|nr:DUF2313 domain-containing protein [Lachnospiraceae bacterium]
MKEFNFEKFPTSESAKRQLSYVSEEFYEKSYVGKWLYQVMGLEYDAVRRILEELPEQMFIETATWGLKYHEIKWQLPVRENLSYEERRKLIYEKRDCRRPMTPYRMEQHLRDVTDFEVHVSDIHDKGEYWVKYNILNGAWLLDGSIKLSQGGTSFPHPNVFRAVFIGEGTLNVKRIKKTLDRIKQSHTMYILCEWILLVLENQELEKVNLQGMDIQMRMPFFMFRTFNGGWLLDGSVNLCQVAICKMDLEVIVGPVEVLNENQIDFGYDLGFSLPFVPERIINDHVSFLQILDSRYADSLENICVIFPVYEQESFEECFVTVKKNLWTLDGTEKLDGSKFLNAERREESL